jgi:hypothetical protein
MRREALRTEHHRGRDGELVDELEYGLAFSG